MSGDKIINEVTNFREGIVMDKDERIEDKKKVYTDTEQKIVTAADKSNFDKFKSTIKDNKNINSGTLIIGTGAGGCNAASYATQYGFETVGINTASEDMVGLKLNHMYVIPGAYGAGGERDRGKDVFIDNFDDIFEFLKANVMLEYVKNIFVVGTGGGGSGSATVPMLSSFLQDSIPTANIFAAGLLGSLDEKIKAQENMRDFIEELIESEVNYMIFDNSRVNGSSFNDVYKRVNTEFANACRIISGEFMKPGRNNADAADIQKLWIHKSRIHVTFGKMDRALNTTANSCIDDKIIESVNTSSQLSIGSVTPKYNTGVFVNIDEKFYTSIDDNFPRLSNEFGEPYDGFKHLQFRDNNDSSPDFAFIAVGLAQPIDRYELIIDRINSYYASSAFEERTISSVKKGENKKSIGNNFMKSTDVKTDLSKIDTSILNKFRK